MSNEHRVEGYIFFEYGLPASGFPVRLYGRGFGGVRTPEPLGKGKTDDQGFYEVSYDLGDKPANLEVWIVDADKKEIPLSRTLHGKGKEEKTQVNLVAPAAMKPLPAEYQRLTAGLKPHVGEMKKLADAKENAKRQDLTMLNSATGWDARLIALASNAARLSADVEVGLSQEVLYGMFRAGLPSDKILLAQVSEETVDHALWKVNEAGIVDLSDQQVAEVKKQFGTFSRNTRLSMHAPGSRSTYKMLLEATGLEKDAREKFASVYLKHRGDAAQLWEKAAEAGVDPRDIQTLQLQGKLAFLTKNSEAMTTRLQKDMGIGDPVELVEQGFYQPDKWKAEVRELAGNDEQGLNALIPPAYGDEKVEVEDRLSAYAEDMARKVRLSYPTQVVGHMVEQDDADEFKLGTARSATTTLLKNAVARGFRLGETPVGSFVRDHPEVLNGISANVVETAQQGMKTLQRGYQTTPSNEAMSTFLSLGLTSAYDVVAFSLDSFLDHYGDKFPSLKQAELVYRKAQQVSNVTYNLFTTAKKLDSEPLVYGMSASTEVRESVKNELIKHFPTMRSLFGSIDFCECEHCRAVLSPAAYLVDLLQFIDAENPVWENFLTDWKQKHNGECYQKNWNYDHTNETFQDEFKKPYYALIERRPDLPHIPLTCENTNTALPYIDVVNEILEYYVANEKLDDNAAHDTGEATTAELLAEPQNVVAEAYDWLQKARYPLNLPFDLWIETVRQFCDYFETPLWRLLEAFHEDNELFVPTQSYDRAAIFIESLGLSPAEYTIFTDPDPLDKWYELYGYQTDDKATTIATDADTGQRIDLNSAKALSRRLGVTYKELVEIVQTGFVNPKLVEMTPMYKLGVAIQDVLFYRDHRELLTKDSDTLSQDDQNRRDEVKAFEQWLDDQSVIFQASGFDAKVWLNNALENNAFDDILMLSDVDAGCNFDMTTLRYANGQAADAIAFLKINLFVRLWRKLGWTIEESDRALQAFVPKNTPFDAAHLAKSPLRTALIYLAHLKVLDEKLRVGKENRLKLITLWSDLTTMGKKPLYAQLFLTRSMLKSGEVFDDVAETYMSVFDDPLGQYLSNDRLAAMAERIKHKVSRENVKSTDKIDPAVFYDGSNVSIDYDDLQEVQSLAYLGVLTNEVKAQLAALSPSPALAPLLDAVQTKAKEFMLIKGHLLALQGGLGLTADEINHILTAAGTSIEHANLSLANVSLLYRYGLLAKALKLSVRELITLKHLSVLDPFAQTLRFVEMAGYVKESGLKIEDLDYLLRHHIEDTVGKYSPNTEATLVLMKTLAEGVRAIGAEHAVPDDAGAISEEVLRQKLGRALPHDVAERFLSMMNGTVEFTATMTGVQPENQLKPEEFADEPSIRQISYNTTRQEQKLTFRGVLFDKEKATYTGRYSSELFTSLIDEIQYKQKDFFKKYLQVFFDDYNQLFAINPIKLTESEKQVKLLWAIGSHLGAPNVLTDDLLKVHIGSVLPLDVAGTFLKMWMGDIEYVAVQEKVEPLDKLDPSGFTEPEIEVSYDEEKKEQTLTYRGVLLNAQSATLKGKYSLTLFVNLLDDVQKQVREFYEKNLRDFFTSDDFEILFTPIRTSLTEVEKQNLRKEKYARLEQAFLFYVLIVDPTVFSEALLKQTLTSVSSVDIANTFLKMCKGEMEYVTVQKKVKPKDKLDPNVFTEPEIKVSYDEIGENQTLTYRGVLLEAQSTSLKAKYSKPLFANMLDDIQNQAREFYEKNLQDVLVGDAFNLLFVVIPNGINETLKQSLIRQQRTRLAQTFLPFLQQRLIQQFIVQTLTAQTGADPVLVESLLTDARLLGTLQPAGALQPLLTAFTATSERGLTATFFASPDGSGAVLATLAFADAYTGLKDKDGNPLKPAGANSARFEGYLEVPASGAYRFYVALDRQNAEAELRFDHLPDPLFLSTTAADTGAEISKYLELKPGVPYHFNLALRELNGGEARLLVQGETLPKDSLAQLTLYPLTAIEHGERALILLNKALQLTQSLNLNKREVRYLLTHAADFDNVNLSKLPTRESDGSPAGARALFTQFLRLAGYARAKRDLAGGTDDLIGVFGANEVGDMDKVYPLIAKLTRRDEATVKDTANALFTAPDFANEVAVLRLWDALQVVKRFEVPVASIVGWTRIVGATATPEQRFTIARDLKETIKARFEPGTWQRVAQPIFDKLRQHQRDALVAHVMHQHGFARMEQLYEYFLIDPGMEPKVQTSRIRLAIASVQLFIQRCLLNMEKQVHPSVINSRQWGWIKCYRGWRANRNLFLFTENWLEPEFRDDKTHLFSELEGNLLQGDVSSDLVEDAFLNYLKKLDDLARLDIVAMHLEDKADPALNTLHVIGRSYSQPKYFYRRYAHQVWTPWEPVTAKIEGDHLAPVVWRDRLYLFWVTFMDEPDENAQPGSTTDEPFAETKVSTVGHDLKAAGANKQIEMQLHWSEYLQGNWSACASSEFVPVMTTFNGNIPLTMLLKSDTKSVFIHVSKEPYDENGEELGVYIHLGGAIKQAFYLAGRNSIPEKRRYGGKPKNPYNNADTEHANRYKCNGSLTVKFTQRITTEDGKSPVPSSPKETTILTQGGAYTLLPCDNTITLGSPEIASLVKPLFYQDNAHTLFIEPTVSERTIEEWQEWVPGGPQLPEGFLRKEVPKEDATCPDLDLDIRIDVKSMIPKQELIFIDPRDYTDSLIKVTTEPDWVVNRGTVVLFEDNLIGQGGRAQVAVLTSTEVAGAVVRGGRPVNVHPGSGLAPGITVVAEASNALDLAGIVQAAGGLNVVGSSGFNPALAQNFDALKHSGNLGDRLIGL